MSTPDVVTGEMGPVGVAGRVGACLISLVITPLSPLSWPPGAGVSWPGPCVLCHAGHYLRAHHCPKEGGMSPGSGEGEARDGHMSPHVWGGGRRELVLRS